jgi:hypothetical protein
MVGGIGSSASQVLDAAESVIRVNPWAGRSWRLPTVKMTDRRRTGQWPSELREGSVRLPEI